MPVRLKTTDPFWWALFSAGGTLAAFLLPAHILITGVGVAFGWIDAEVIGYQRVLSWLQNPLLKIYLLLLVSLSFFHWAHRFRYVLIDMGLRRVRGAVAVFCYGTAILVTILTVGLLFFCL